VTPRDAFGLVEQAARLNLLIVRQVDIDPEFGCWRQP